MTDKFPMHQDFPMDAAYSAKANERGFDPDRALWHFEEWRDYWTGRPSEHKTPRGWLQCWDNNLKAKARNAAKRVPNRPSGRFERNRQDDRLLSNPAIRWVGGIGYNFVQAKQIEERSGLRGGISEDERAVLRAWNLKPRG